MTTKKAAPESGDIFLTTGGKKPEGLVYVVGVDTTEKSLAAFYYALKRTQPNDQLKIFHCEKIDLLAEEGLFDHSHGDRRKEVTTFFEYLSGKCKEQNVSGPPFWVCLCGFLNWTKLNFFFLGLQRYCEFETQSFMGGTSAIGKNIAEYAKTKNADTIIVGNRGKQEKKRKKGEEKLLNLED